MTECIYRENERNLYLLFDMFNIKHLPRCSQEIQFGKVEFYWKWTNKIITKYCSRNVYDLTHFSSQCILEDSDGGKNRTREREIDAYNILGWKSHLRYGINDDFCQCYLSEVGQFHFQTFDFLTSNLRAP